MSCCGAENAEGPAAATGATSSDSQQGPGLYGPGGSPAALSSKPGNGQGSGHALAGRQQQPTASPAVPQQLQVSAIELQLYVGFST